MDNKQLKTVTKFNYKVDINIQKSIYKLTRTVGKTLYWNESCYSLLDGNEIRAITTLILFLYKNKKETTRDGLTLTWIYNNCPLASTTIKLYLLALAPAYINMVGTKGGGKYIAHYYSLNEYGLELARKLSGEITEQIRIEEKQNDEIRIDNQPNIQS